MRRAEASSQASRNPLPEGDARQGLVQVHGVELLAVGLEAGYRIFPIKLAHLMTDLARLRVKAAQDAIEADDEVDAAEFGVELLQHAGGGAQHVLRSRDREDQTFVYGTKERETAVGVHVADRAAVVVAADLHDEGIGREAEGTEIVGQEPDGGGVFARRRLGVEFVDDAVLGVGRGDDELDGSGLEVLRLEYAEGELALDHHQDRCALGYPAAVQQLRTLEREAVAG